MDKRRNPDPVAEFFAEAVTEIRQKLVEEPWFGRRVTGPLQGHEIAPSEQLGWTLATEKQPADHWDKLTAELEKERAHQPEPDRERDIDR